MASFVFYENNVASKYLSKKLNCNLNQIYTASTGVIGEQLDSKIIINGINKMRPAEKPDWLKAANAIRTTDTFSKIVSRKCHIHNVEIDIVYLFVRLSTTSIKFL